MKQAPHVKLSRRERQIMDVVWARGGATAAEVHEAIADAPSFSATRATIRTLELKGHLRHEERGLRYVYLPVVPQDQARKSALRHLIDTFFQGSAEHLVAALIDPKETTLPAKELHRIERLVRRARKEAK